MESNNTLRPLAEKINSFDHYYTQGSNATFTRLNPICNEIKRELSKLSTDELIELRSLVTASESELEFCFYELTDLPKKAVSQKRSSVMSTAWILFKDNVCSTFSDALRMAWKRSKLISKLKNGIAYFSFKKADGSTRKAIGSLRNGNYNYQHKTNKKDTNLSIIKYFDIECRSFRSCKIDRLLSVA